MTHECILAIDQGTTNTKARDDRILGRVCSPRPLGVPSLTAIRDPPAGQVVRRELDVDVVARGDADAEAAQASREAR